MLRAILCLVALLLTSTLAAAQPSAVDTRQQGARKSKGFAVGVTVGTAAASAVMVAAALHYEDRDEVLAGGFATAGAVVGLFGPSLGHVYVGEWGRAALGTAGRLIGGALLLGAAYGEAISEGSTDSDPLIVAGVGLIAVSTLYELFDTPAAVDRANRRSVQVAPTAIVTPTGSATGLAVGGTF